MTRWITSRPFFSPLERPTALGFGFVGVYFALRPSLRTLPAVSEAEPADFDVRDPEEAAD